MRAFWKELKLPAACTLVLAIGSLTCLTQAAAPTPTRGTSADEYEVRTTVKRALRKLGSRSCVDRQQAAADLLGLLGYKDVTSVFERELRSAPPKAQVKGTVILNSLKKIQAFEEAGGYEDWFRKTVAHAWEGSEAGRPGRYRALKDNLLQIARDRSKDYFQRNLAMTTIAHVVNKYEGVEDEIERDGVPVRAWRDELFSLQGDRDLDVRVMAAILSGSLKTLSEKERRLTISRLIRGLRHPEFDARMNAGAALMRLSGQAFCVDPTDAPAQQESAIRQWEAWWARTSDASD
jgi:hypothetical protein